jgi:hypothetical protein
VRSPRGDRGEGTAVVKIEWLNAEMTEARVTRGFWWWKRVAFVRRDEKGEEETLDYGDGESETWVMRWYYPASELWCSYYLNRRIENERARDLSWQRVRPVPRARLLKPYDDEGAGA